MKKFLIALILVLTFSNAFARFENITEDVNAQFDRMSGYIISVDGDTVYFDKGFEDTVYVGLEMKVYRESEAIVHPVTGEILGKKKVFVADLVVNDVQDKYSTAKIVKKALEPQVKDLTVYNPPLPVDIELVKLPKRLRYLMKEEVTKLKNIKTDPAAKIKLIFTQEKEGGIRYEIFNKNTNSIVSSKYYSDKELGESLSGRVTRDVLKSDIIDKAYKSIAIGHPYRDKEIYVVTADNHDVDIYRFSGKGFSKIGSLEREFDNIQAVEVMDLNGNGVDEIFITELKNKKFMMSYIYEMGESGRFKEVKSNVPQILRATYSGGKKIMLSQRIGNDGNYLGNVNKFEFVNDYVRTDVIPGSLNSGIFGFGYGDLDGDGKDEVIYINNDNKMEIRKDGKTVTTSVETFSDTPFFFIVEEETQTREKFKISSKADEDPIAYFERKKFLKGRVFVNADNRIYITKNFDKLAMMPNTKSYKGSSFAVYEYDKKGLHRVWESDYMEPIIVDYYMYEEFGRTYLFMLRNEGRGIFSDGESQFIYIETK